ncbi:unnamed protein product, partial [Phaeothamnion confervicola]
DAPNEKERTKLKVYRTWLNVLEPPPVALCIKTHSKNTKGHHFDEGVLIAESGKEKRRRSRERGQKMSKKVLLPPVLPFVRETPKFWKHQMATEAMRSGATRGETQGLALSVWKDEEKSFVSGASRAVSVAMDVDHGRDVGDSSGSDDSSSAGSSSDEEGIDWEALRDPKTGNCVFLRSPRKRSHSEDEGAYKEFGVGGDGSGDRAESIASLHPFFATEVSGPAGLLALPPPGATARCQGPAVSSHDAGGSLHGSGGFPT